MLLAVTLCFWHTLFAIPALLCARKRQPGSSQLRLYNHLLIFSFYLSQPFHSFLMSSMWLRQALWLCASALQTDSNSCSLQHQSILKNFWPPCAQFPSWSTYSITMIPIAVLVFDLHPLEQHDRMISVLTSVASSQRFPCQLELWSQYSPSPCMLKKNARTHTHTQTHQCKLMYR